ncbi:MAG TPA: purine-nucleoside phosphorylase [Methylocystis sp.]|nr:purine-nucleoside phosphorylase [Methylocystis sp.]
MSDAAAATEIIKSRNKLGSAETAIVLGRHFSSVAELLDKAIAIPYGDLPKFPAEQVPGGEAIIGAIDGAPVLVLKGRPEFHETGDPSLMGGAFETLGLLGVRSIFSLGFVTSANAQINPGNLVAVSDHIDFKGLNPLIGASGDKNSFNLNDAYDKRLLRRLRSAASAAGVGLQEGVLIWFSGPSFETPAEVKAARALGADVLGFSLAPEAILARRYGVPFAGVAVVTDFAAGFLGGYPIADYGRSHVVAGLVAARRLVRAFAKTRG